MKYKRVLSVFAALVMIALSMYRSDKGMKFDANQVKQYSHTVSKVS